MMDNYENIIEQIKKSFCNLTKSKVRDNYIEIITNYSTLNNKFISVFIFKKNNRYIVSDLGWFDQNYYDTPFYEESEDMIKKIKSNYLNSYDIKVTFDERSNCFYYKSTDSVSHISSLVYDVSNFLLGSINAYCIQFKDVKEERHKENFRKNVNHFLEENYGTNVKLRTPLSDIKNVKFNAIIEKNSKLNLINYVTGSSQYYFENDLRRSIVNFDLSLKSKYSSSIKDKITIINDESEDFSIEKSYNIYELLVSRTTKPPVMWSEKEKIFEYI